MRIEVTPQFEKMYAKLPIKTKLAAEKQIEYFLQDQFHPSLNVEKLKPRSKHLWSLRVDKKYRIIFVHLQTNVVVFVAVGAHDFIYKFTNRL
jgi:mRNA-degrading endonuclease RelE of RelBE toxin-antitoxin system